MLLTKTDRARAALRDRDPALSPRDRQILVLCNGSRSMPTLASLMGDAIVDEIARLMEAGFVVENGAANATPVGHAKPRTLSQVRPKGPAAFDAQ